jgi:hypothetical protein
MRIVELLLDEESLQAGIQAISIVESPAIEEDFIALKEEERIELKTIDKDKRVLLGAALIPNKPIYRKSGEDEYYIYFSQDTVRKASELFFINGNQNKATLEHQMDITGLSVVESWIIEGEQDKSKMYGMDLPVGTWMVSMKVHNDEIWNDYVNSVPPKVKGFSIEGFFVDKVEASKQDPEELEAQSKLDNIKNVILEAIGKQSIKVEMSILSKVLIGVIDFNSGVKKLESEIKSVSSSLNGMVKNVDSNMSSIDKALRELESKVKELGIPLSNLVDTKKIGEYNQNKKVFEKQKSAVKQISKLG